MKFSEKWLREWVNPDLSTDELLTKLTQAGLEVNGIEPVAGDFSGVIVGQVTKLEAHPDADKLRLCQVDVAGEAILSIVCGASNVKVGLKTPFAPIGTTLPVGFTLEPKKIRGILSEGMLCSEEELGLAESSKGIMELPNDTEVGMTLEKLWNKIYRYLRMIKQAIMK